MSGGYQMTLDDLWGIGIALFVFFMFLIRHDLADSVKQFLQRYAAAHSVMSREEAEDDDDLVVAGNVAPATTTPQNNNNLIAIDNNERNALLFEGKADALAAMVHAGKVGETEGIKIVYGIGPSSTNKTYQAAREMLRARLARMQPEKFKLTPEQEAAREALGLTNRQKA